MKRILYISIALGIFIAGLAAALVPAAKAHSGNSSMTCTSVTFTYQDFTDAANTITESATVDGATVYSGSFSFTGTGGSHSVSISVPADGAGHSIGASASWNTNGHEGSFSEQAEVNCGSPPAERCPPGMTPTAGKDGEPGNDECELPQQPPATPPAATTPTTPPAVTIPPAVTTPTTPTPTTPAAATTPTPEPAVKPLADKPPVSKPNRPSKPTSPNPPAFVPPAGEETLPFTP